MSDAELERAVTEPARLAGLRLEPGLVEIALRDVAGESGALPLLSHALLATWERRDGRTLTVEGYRETGGVASAIARTADGVLASLPPDARDLTRSMFLRLTELGDGAAESRRRVNIDELVPDAVSPEVVQALLERLAEARLVTLGEGTAEVSHEVLIREWPTLRRWLEEDRDGIRLHRQLGAAARLWDTGGRDPSDLYRGHPLDAAADWTEHIAPTSTPPSAASSTPACSRPTASATPNSAPTAGCADCWRRRRPPARRAIAGVIALIQRSHAQAQRSHAQAQALTSDAERVGAQALVEKNLDLAMLYAVAGVKLQNRLETRGDLLEELQNNSFAIRYIRASHNQITSLAVDPSGKLLATGDSAGVVRFEDMSRWRPTGTPVALSGSIPQEAMAFSPDGRTLAVLTEGGSPRQCGSKRDPRTSTRSTSRPTGSASLARGAACSPRCPIRQLRWPMTREGETSRCRSRPQRPTGRSRATRCGSSTPSTGRVIWRRKYPLRAGQLEARVAFVSGGTLLTSAQQGDTLLWDTSTGRVTRRFPIGGQPAIAPDGVSVALAVNRPGLGTAAARVAMLNLRTGRFFFLPASVPNVWLRGFGFTPDGRTLVGETIHGDIYIWDVASGSIVNTIPAPPGALASEVLDPTGRTVLVGSQAGTVVAFDIAGTRRLGKAFVWNPTAFGFCNVCNVVNPQSDLMATENGDGSVALIDLRTLRRTTTLPPGDGSQAQPLGFSPDGHTLLTGDLAGRLTLWNVATPQRSCERSRCGAPVYWGAVSPTAGCWQFKRRPEQSPTAQVQVRPVDGGKPLWTHELQDGTGGVVLQSRRTGSSGAGLLHLALDGGHLGRSHRPGAVRRRGASRATPQRSPTRPTRASLPSGPKTARSSSGPLDAASRGRRRSKSPPATLRRSRSPPTGR